MNFISSLCSISVKQKERETQTRQQACCCAEPSFGKSQKQQQTEVFWDLKKNVVIFVLFFSSASCQR